MIYDDDNHDHNDDHNNNNDNSNNNNDDNDNDNNSTTTYLTQSLYLSKARSMKNTKSWPMWSSFSSMAWSPPEIFVQPSRPSLLKSSVTLLIVCNQTEF